MAAAISAEVARTRRRVADTRAPSRAAGAEASPRRDDSGGGESSRRSGAVTPPPHRLARWRGGPTVLQARPVRDVTTCPLCGSTALSGPGREGGGCWHLRCGGCGTWRVYDLDDRTM